MPALLDTVVAPTLDRVTAEQFIVEPHGDKFDIAPRAPSPTRRCLRPIAAMRVEHDAGTYPEINISMGRIAIDAGDATPRAYQPYSRDPRRSVVDWMLSPEELNGDSRRCVQDLTAWVRTAIERACPGNELDAGNALSSARLTRVADRLTKIHNHAFGWFHPTEMLLLHLASCAARLPDRHVIEIGSFQGRSTAVLAAAMEDVQSRGLLVSVDPNELSPAQATVAAANVATFDAGKRLVQVQRRSNALGGIFADSAFGLAFIDGSHDFDDVRRDFEMCDRLLAPGGVLLLHDVYPAAHLGYRPQVDGPTRCADEVILPTGRYEPIGAAHLTIAMRKKE
ncbi:MAG: class I SAM-dependent methyltransferase [Phycisphaerae bacterium]